MHGLKGKQAELYNDKRGRCVKYFYAGDNAGRYKVPLVGGGGERLPPRKRENLASLPEGCLALPAKPQLPYGSPKRSARF